MDAVMFAILYLNIFAF